MSILQLNISVIVVERRGKTIVLIYETGLHCKEQFFIHKPVRQIPPDRKGVTLDYIASDSATLICSPYSAEPSGPLIQLHMDLGRAYSVTQHRQ